MKRIGVIDIGSNTTRLLVAERVGSGLRRLLSQRDFTRLARGLAADGSIQPQKLDQLIAVIETQLALARVIETEAIHAIATAATRDASNREAVLARIEESTGLGVEVLDVEDEARLAFLGATHALPLEQGQRIAVIDVGGGSTELAVGTVEGGVEWSTSFRLGSAGLTDRAIHGDPPDAADLDAAGTTIAEILDRQEFPAVDQAIAVGGSASTLRRLVGNLLDHETLERAIRLITEYPAAIVAEEFGIEIERVQVLAAGVIILEAVSDRIGQPLRIGKGGVREGKLLELLA